MFLYYGGYYGGYGMRFDSSYLIYLLIALIVPMLAQGYLSSTFNQYLRVRASSGLTGADVARRILRSKWITTCSFDRGWWSFE